jgi:NAD(P)-dependent dehydrogenase (short-subunit alcohol dehydrogenase family)
MSLKGKSVIVTGGAHGIGKCIVQFLLREGMNVVIADVNEKAAADCVAEYRAFGRIEFIVTDVGDETSAANCVRRTVGMFDGLDVLVNNAGFRTDRKFEELTLEEWNGVIGTNLTGCFLMTKYAIPHLRKNKGAIVNIASIKGLQSVVSEENSESYSAAKGGLIALTHALAISQGPDIRVNCISPGWIVTSSGEEEHLAESRDFLMEVNRCHPAGRIGRPEDIAGMVRYLLSDEAGFITGQNFIVDGGITKKIIYPT